MSNIYQHSKIYLIRPTCEHEEGDVYVGATTQLLCKRMAKHRSDYITWKNGKRNLVMSFLLFDKYGVDNCAIELLEQLPYSTIEELRAREGFHQRSMKCINKCITGRTKHEYYINNKDAIVKYREQNREHILQKRKEYYQNNKIQILEKKLEKIICECGMELCKSSLAAHRKSKQHLNIMNHDEK